MTRKLFLLFNHTLTDFQVEAALSSLGVQEIVHLPSDLKALWQQIPPELPEIKGYLGPVMEWLLDNARESDHVLIQGDFGATFLMVKFAFEHGLRPVYSTSRREAFEEHNGDGSVRIVHQFQHQIYRRYGI
jgi:hypothetical protein